MGLTINLPKMKKLSLSFPFVIFILLVSWPFTCLGQDLKKTKGTYRTSKSVDPQAETTSDLQAGKTSSLPDNATVRELGKFATQVSLVFLVFNTLTFLLDTASFLVADSLNYKMTEETGNSSGIYPWFIYQGSGFLFQVVWFLAHSLGPFSYLEKPRQEFVEESVVVGGSVEETVREDCWPLKDRKRAGL